MVLRPFRTVRQGLLPDIHIVPHWLTPNQETHNSVVVHPLGKIVSALPHEVVDMVLYGLDVFDCSA